MAKDEDSTRNLILSSEELIKKVQKPVDSADAMSGKEPAGSTRDMIAGAQRLLGPNDMPKKKGGGGMIAMLFVIFAAAAGATWFFLGRS